MYTDPSGANTITRYYSLGGQRVAIYDGTDLEYILTDQQGSTMAVLDDTGALITNSEQRYLPFGDVRTDMDTADETDFGYTGQGEITRLDQGLIKEGLIRIGIIPRLVNPGGGILSTIPTLLSTTTIKIQLNNGGGFCRMVQ